MEIAYIRRNISNKSEDTLNVLQNRGNCRIFRTDLYVSTMKLACIAFGVLKAIEIAFKRRNISNRTDITHCFLQNRGNGRILRTFGHFFQAKNGVHIIRRVKCDGNSD